MSTFSGALPTSSTPTPLGVTMTRLFTAVNTKVVPTDSLKYFFYQANQHISTSGILVQNVDSATGTDS